VGATEPLQRVGIASEEYDEARRKNFEKALEKVMPREHKKKFSLERPKPKK
jgi:hypothetical protein